MRFSDHSVKLYIYSQFNFRRPQCVPSALLILHVTSCKELQKLSPVCYCNNECLNINLIHTVVIFIIPDCTTAYVNYFQAIHTQLFNSFHIYLATCSHNLRIIRS